MAGDAQHRREGIERAECDIADRMPLRQQHEQRAGGGADVDDAERGLAERQQRARQLEVHEDAGAAPAHPRHPDEIGEQHAEQRQTDRPVGPVGQMIDLAYGGGVDEKTEAEHQSHAEPEGDAGHDRQARDLAGREAGGPVEPEAHGAAGDEGKAEREGNGVAREGSQRRQPVGHLGAEMAQGEPVIAGQGDIADAGEAEGRRDLIRARRREGGLEAGGIDPDQGAAEDEGGNRDDEDADAQTDAAQQHRMFRRRHGQSRDQRAGLIRFRQARSPARFNLRRHAHGGSSQRLVAYRERPPGEQAPASGRARPP